MLGNRSCIVAQVHDVNQPKLLGLNWMRYGLECVGSGHKFYTLCGFIGDDDGVPIWAQFKRCNAPDLGAVRKNALTHQRLMHCCGDVLM
jgi:hypothetical protein